jgi:hypothetical protein
MCTRLTRLTCLVLAVLICVTCDRGVSDVGRALYVRNESDRPLVLWFEWAPREGGPADESEVARWLLPPSTAGIAIPRGLGTLEGTVGLSNVDCQVLATWESRFGGEVVVVESGATAFRADNQGDPAPTVPGAVRLDEATTCGPGT